MNPNGLGGIIQLIDKFFGGSYPQSTLTYASSHHFHHPSYYPPYQFSHPPLFIQLSSTLISHPTHLTPILLKSHFNPTPHITHLIHISFPPITHHHPTHLIHHPKSIPQSLYLSLPHTFHLNSLNNLLLISY